MPSPALTVTVTASPEAPEPLCWTLLPNSSLTSKTASSPHGCPGPSIALTNERATLARSARPASVTLSRTARPVISAPPSLPPAPREVTGCRAATPGYTPDSAAHVKPRPAATAARPWPSVESRRLHRPRRRHRPVRYASVDTATQRSTALRDDTQRDKEETARVAAYAQLTDRLRRWWQVLGSNQRRLSRRFYSPILLFEAYAAYLRLCASRRDLGPPPSAMRPCARSRSRGDARTGTDGGVRRPRLHAPDPGLSGG
jgi:hypothetical protein